MTFTPSTTRKIWDWRIAEARHSAARISFYREYFQKPITEEFFVEQMQKIRDQRKGSSYHYSPSHLKNQYRGLKSNFGFFV